ncbi:PP2C family protein-serine/threonine phosphatase [Leucobacter massiliensis]|uniref:Serine/threonine protein phosphatase n=1 Tax=Leucobacter massiliensis TaxID=1686285 RepID=A0A2S9QKS3_9MICO|nr:protein phosphatase 2C domain-containing protein [Leucobacter massiliensis]PRI10183.1 serine/threonine protein phosphatase [Leucobacter massiliensis]
MRTGHAGEPGRYPGPVAAPVVEAASRSDVGVRRAVNEDAVIAQWPVYLVADGMGGHEAGELASAAAVRAFAELAGASRLPTIAEVSSAIERARAAVDDVAYGTQRGAGCTLTGAVLVAHEGRAQWYVLNIGDSRVYQHRGSTLQQITLDHSLQAELAAAGDAAAERTPRNVITRALGSDDARHDAWLLPVSAGTRLLICSDGLTTELSDEELRAVLAVGGRPEAVAEELVRRACEAGGRDNVTVIVVDTVSGPAAWAVPAVQGAAAAEETGDETLEVTRPVR